MLVADDNDGNITNGTPNESVICAAFASRSIYLTGNYGVCSESAGAGSHCRADVNLDGILDIFDFVEFQNTFAAGDMKADFTADGVLDVFDFLTFQRGYAEGCW